MIHRATKAAVLLGALATSACTNPAQTTSGAPGTVTAGPNPATPAYFQTTIGDRVLFPVDQSNLTAEAQSTLNGQASWLNQNIHYGATIQGHADEQGTREYNLALGARRASAVQEYLISRGVAGTRVDTVTFGKERPLEVCSEESCYARNRRAVTAIKTVPGS